MNMRRNAYQRRPLPARGKALLLLALLAAGCGAPGISPSSRPTATTGVMATPAVPPPTAATARLLTPGGELLGQAILTATPTGVEIALTASGLKPGPHGFHIHTNGTCAPGPDASGQAVDFGAAGERFDPPDPANKAHAGELRNLTADPSGKASARYLNTQVTLTPGPASVIGRALVVHADPHDHAAQPAGKSGARLLCGRIEPAQVESVAGLPADNARQDSFSFSLARIH